MKSALGRSGLSILAIPMLLLSLAGGACQDQAASIPPPAAKKGTDFDANRAFEHVKKMVSLGPHPAGSAAIKQAQEYIIQELKSYGLKVNEDKFDAPTTRGVIPMNNIIGVLPGKKSDVVIISGHYDTAPTIKNFVGANDGGSSTASVLEMARVLAKTTPEYTIWFTFFDGEEAEIEWEANNGLDNTYGSRHMVEKMQADGSLSQIKAMVLVDMIGDKNLDLNRDSESTRWLVDILWTTARSTDASKYFLGNEAGYGDDHIPFRQAGIPAVDLIDLDYGPGNSYWHTPQDTLDKVSGESIKAVSDVVLLGLPDIFSRLSSGPPRK